MGFFSFNFDCSLDGTFNLLSINILDRDSFLSRFVTMDHSDVSRLGADDLGQKLCQPLVGLTITRRRRDSHMNGLVNGSHLAFSGSWLDKYPQHQVAILAKLNQTCPQIVS